MRDIDLGLLIYLRVILERVIIYNGGYRIGYSVIFLIIRYLMIVIYVKFFVYIDSYRRDTVLFIIIVIWLVKGIYVDYDIDLYIEVI